MKGDFTRFSFNARRHYNGVLKQQGRVDLDADWNEQVQIQNHLDIVRTKDIIGPCGVPAKGGGFEIVVGNGLDFSISPGRIYVDGILCQLEPDSNDPQGFVNYKKQPDYPQAPDIEKISGENVRKDLIYLDVWKRHVTVIEDPLIQEKALGGPDTTTRIKTVCQVKVLTGVQVQGPGCEVTGWEDKPSRGRLSTGVVSPPPSTDPCKLALVGGYTGLENRLYRVEIHQSGNPDLGIAGATFKWSRDNGSVVFPIRKITSGPVPQSTVEVNRLGRDQVLTINENDWVEVIDDSTELAGKPGAMARVLLIEEGQLTLTLNKDVSNFDTLDGHCKVRKWDQASDALPVTSGVPLNLEDGIQITFSGDNFKTGDYWTFASRTASGTVAELKNATPEGIKHHYCKLAVISWQPGQTGQPGTIGGKLCDCRKTFRPLTDSGCCTVTVGDGVNSFGDFSDIQEAIKALFDTFSRACIAGGKVCILPGIHRLKETVEIKEYSADLQGRPGLTICGCGIQTHIIGPESGAAFHVIDSTYVEFCSFYLETRAGQSGILIDGNNQWIKVARCMINHGHQFVEGILGDKQPEAGVSAVGGFRPGEVSFKEGLPKGALPLTSSRSRKEKIEAMLRAGEGRSDISGPGPSPLTIGWAEHVRIEDNIFTNFNNQYGASRLSIQGYEIFMIRNELTEVSILVQSESQSVYIHENFIYEASGPGIQVQSSTDDISIRNNLIYDIFGGPGIALGGSSGLKKVSGSMTDSEAKKSSQAETEEIKATGVERSKLVNVGMTDVRIVDNQISYASNSGISTIYGSDAIQDLTIAGNQITNCIWSRPDKSYDPEVVGGIVLREVAQVRILDNYIAENGTTNRIPACGVFISSCECVKMDENTIIDNGSAQEEAVTIIDFLKMENKLYDSPLIAENTTFTAQDLQGNAQKTLKIKAGLICFQGILSINPPYPVQSAILDLVGNVDTIATINAYDGKNNLVFQGNYNPSAGLMTVFGFPSIEKVNISLNRGILTLNGLTYKAVSTTFQAGVIIADVNPRNYPVAYPQADEAAARIHGNTVVCPRGQALIMTGLGAMFIGDNTLSTQAARRQPMTLEGAPAADQKELSGFFSLALCVSIYNSGSAAQDLPPTLFAVGTGIHIEQANAASLVADSLPGDGRVMFHGNQVTLNSAEDVIVSTSIISLDDASLQDNQIKITLDKSTFYYDTLIFARTVRATGNRFAEYLNPNTSIPPRRQFYSLISLSPIAGIATSNQADYCIGFDVKSPNIIVSLNQVLKVVDCPGKNNFSAQLGNILPPASSPSAFEAAAKVQESQSTKLTQEANSLEATLGKDNPSVTRLRRKASDAESLSRQLSMRAQIESLRPVNEPSDWTVFGKVLDMDGKPAEGLLVRISDKDRKYYDRLGKAVVGDQGQFAFVFNEKDMAELGKDLPDLHLIVEDRSGKVLYTSKDSISYGPGRAEYFETELGLVNAQYGTGH